MKNLLVLLGISAVAIFGAGCEPKDDGPGEAIEEVGEELEDAAEDVAEEVEDQV